MVSFTVRGGEAAAVAVANSTRVFTLAESLGAVESLIDHPHRMTHASLVGSPLAVDPALVRLSVGLELDTDLIADLCQALESATGHRPPTTDHRPPGRPGAAPTEPPGTA
jgi:cystathionine gamma-synthase